MEPSQYVQHDGTGLKRLLDAREVSAEELRDSALRALEEVEPRINAVVHGPFEDAVCDNPDGPFAGVPFAIKDLICSTAGQPLEFGSRMFAGNVADADSTLMERFRRTGLVTVARAATPELGFNANTAPVINGPTRNPWDTGRIPGGSSGGSAALVAARALPFAHASDGGGSIRVPASCCGLVGLKPTRGLVPLGPLIGEAVSGLAIEFAVTRSVRDCAALLDAVCGPASGDKYYVRGPERPYAQEVGANPGKLRIALHTESFWGIPTDPEVAAAVEATARRLEELGHRVERVAPAIEFEEFRSANIAIWSASLAATAYGLGAMLGREVREEDFEAATWATIQHGAGVSALELEMAATVQNAVGRTWGVFLDEHDIFLSPTLPVPPLPVGSLDQDAPRHASVESWVDEVFAFIPYTPIFNVTGQPSLSLPLGMSSAGLPIGVMASAQALRDDLLIRLAAQLEQAMPWADRMPAVHAGALAAA